MPSPSRAVSRPKPCVLGACVLVLAVLAGCSSGGGSGSSGNPDPNPNPNPNPSPEPGAKVTLTLAPFGQVQPSDVREVRVRALDTEGTAALAESVVKDVTSFPVKTTLQVPAGNQLPFTGEGIDASGASIYRAATRVDLAQASTVEVTVEIGSTTPPPPTQGSPPSVTITSPGDGQTFVQGQLVVFAGTVADADSELSQVRVLWSSDIQGPINIDPPRADGSVGFQTVGLSLGVHRITLLALDPEGNGTTAAVSIEIQKPSSEPGPGPGPGPGERSKPEVDSISPDQGPSIGGTQITILGRDFRKGGAVYFGDKPVATQFEGSGKIVCFSPPTDGPGTLDITVANPDGGRTTVGNGYLYDTSLYVSADAANASTQDGSHLHPFSSVGYAAVRARPGYVVKIAEGSYRETVIVPSLRSITFQGAGAGSTIIDGSGGASGDPAFGVVQSDDITIRDLTVGGSADAGLIVVGGGHSRAERIALVRNQDGLLVGAGSALTLTASAVTQNRGNGVLVAGGELVASGISVTQNGDIGFGVVMEGDGRAQSTVLDSSTVSGNGDFGVLGVIDESIDHFTVSGTKITRNGGDAPLPGVILIANAGTQTREVYRIVGSEVSQNPGSGIQVAHGANATIGGGGGERNSLRDNGGFGVGCEPAALASCPAGGNAIAGNDLGDVDPNCPSSCKP